MPFQKGQRPPTSGRKKGTPNRITLAKTAEIAASGLTPLDYMLSVMRDATAEDGRRDDMAKAAAPYVHSRLATTEHKGPDGGPIQHSMEVTFVEAPKREDDD